jgi:hypothetical protein
VQKAFAEIVPDDADPAPVADMIVDVVDTPFGTRPFRIHYDPTQDARTSASPCSTASAPRCSTASACQTC